MPPRMKAIFVHFLDCFWASRAPAWSPRFHRSLTLVALMMAGMAKGQQQKMATMAQTRPLSGGGPLGAP